MPRAKSYDWTQFTLKIEIAVPPQKVFAAWTQKRLVTRWFSVEASIEPKKGGRLFFAWLGGDKMEAKVLGIRKPSLFHFPFGRKGEQVAVKIAKIRGGSLVTLHQFGMKTGARDKVNMHMGCKEGWTFFLTNLKSFLEHGIDLRSHDPGKSYRQSYINS